MLAFNVRPSLAHKQNTIKMAFHWLVDDGPLLVEFGSSQKTPQKPKSELDPLGSAHDVKVNCFNRIPNLTHNFKSVTSA